jgi:hexokinase
MKTFQLSERQLIDMACDFCSAVDDGLCDDGRELSCIPTFINPDDRKDGMALVVDFGGTRARAAIVSVAKHRIVVEKGPVSADIPVTRGVPIPVETFFDAQTGLVQRLGSPSGLPLGYCFSYPARAGRDGDAVLLNWTKGVQVPEMVGRPVGRMLREALEKKGVFSSGVTVVNDTVASLLAGFAAKDAEAHIGLVVGTGTNMAVMITPEQSRKISENGFLHPVPVNLESGNYTPSCLTLWDDHVDRQSDNAGRQRFEKAVSGVYLGCIAQAYLSGGMGDVTFAPDAGQLSDWVIGSDEVRMELARNLFDRSAKLAAATLAGLILFLNRRFPLVSAVIVGEGGLIHNAPGYRSLVERTLRELVDSLALQTATDLIHIDNANLIGAAAAALSHTQAIDRSG